MVFRRPTVVAPHTSLSPWYAEIRILARTNGGGIRWGRAEGGTHDRLATRRGQTAARTFVIEP